MRKLEYGVALLLVACTMLGSGACAPVSVLAVTTPEVTRIGAKYSFRFDVTNHSSYPLTVSAVSAETAINGMPVREHPRYFNPARHSTFWNADPIAPGETVTIYQAYGVRTAPDDCGENYSKLVFHTSQGDFETGVAYVIECPQSLNTR